MKLKSALVLFVAMTMAACGDDDDSASTSTGGSSGTGGSGSVMAGAGGGAGEGAMSEDAVERGRYLVDHVIACPDCHTPRDEMGAPIMDKYMAGSECFVKLENGDCLHARNLTNDETGLKNRSDDEIKKMITEGIRPAATGDEYLNPVMPYYVFANMEPADLDAIVAYLRTIPAVENELPRSDASFDVDQPADAVDPDSIPMPMDDYPEMERALHGRYLATESGLCIECHTPHEQSAQVLDPDKFFIGGEEFPIGLPVTPVSANLTSDSETGLGDWTVDDIVTALHEGIDDEGDGLCPPMPGGRMAAYGGLTDDDALDIAHYIKSLPPKENAIDDMCSLPLP